MTEPAVRRYTFKLKPTTAQAVVLADMRHRHCDLYNAGLQQRIVMGDILWRQERWWLSLVVEQPARRAKGHGHATIKLDLIDSFAAVETAEIGPCGSGPEADLSSADGRITPTLQGVAPQTGAVGPDSWGDRRGDGVAEPIRPGAVGPDSGRNHDAAKIADLQRAMARCKKWSNRYRRLRARKARIEAAQARRRREQLHVWTTTMQRKYASVVLHSPKLTEVTKSGRGNAQRWGAAVKDKARMNRHVLDFAAGEARAQLEYKFAESGGDFQSIEIPDHPTAAGNLLVEASKTVRTAKRRLKRNIA